LEIRRRIIVPHLSLNSGSRCNASHDSKRALSIDWSFENGAQLQLRANLGESPAEVNQPSEIPFYASNPEAAAAIEQGRLPPWSVVWSLRA
jgi:hypothetical protein